MKNLWDVAGRWRDEKMQRGKVWRTEQEESCKFSTPIKTASPERENEVTLNPAQIRLLCKSFGPKPVSHILTQSSLLVLLSITNLECFNPHDSLPKVHFPFKSEVPAVAQSSSFPCVPRRCPAASSP